MIEPQRLDIQYAKAMKNHPYGIALYTPARFSTLNPGAFGYFDHDLEWNPIGHLENSDQLVQKGLSALEGTSEKAPTENGIKWGPMASRNMKGTKIDVEVVEMNVYHHVMIPSGLSSDRCPHSAPAPGIPFTVSSVYSFTNEKDIGALLLTERPITHEHYYHTTPFKRWCKTNALSLIQNPTWGADIKKNGLWIITSTYATKRCAINMWNNGGRALKVGFGGEGVGMVQGSESAEWYYSNVDEGWTEHTTEVDDQSVVFFGGIHFRYRLVGLGKDLKPIQNPAFRGIKDGGTDAEVTENITEIQDPDGNGSIIVESTTYLAEEDEDFLDIWHGR